ncbi:unnamed protein product [Rhizoctonia solani]|uniref:Transmembrane protein n=1 Tax=Rhizoctonia solani TaxID=456999 RepID=A0A8H3DNY2_9AGAM|nr:unnamed protein product [Rhizoctonia solani]
MNRYSKVLVGSLILALANIPVVDARPCYYDRVNRYRCGNRLSRAARIGLGIGIAIAVLFILGVAFCLRRRARRANGGPFIPNRALHRDKPHQGGPGYFNQNGHAHGTPNYPVNEPQHPAPIYQGDGGYAPPNGPPPTNYAPPPGPPPAK